MTPMSSPVPHATPSGAAFSDTLELPANESDQALLRLALFAMAAFAALHGPFPLSLGPVAPEYALGLVLGLLGWWAGVLAPTLRTYLRFAVPVVVIAVISLVAADSVGTLQKVGATLSWFVLLPGIAALTREPRALRILLRALIAATSVLLVVVAYRFFRGVPVTDGNRKQLLEVNRNFIDIGFVWLVPVMLWSPLIRIPRAARLAFVVMTAIWLLASEGRTGTLSFLLAPLLFFLLKPADAVSRVGRTVAVVGVVVAVYLGVTSAQLPWLPAAERLGELTGSAQLRSGDETRVLLNKKSFALIRKNPVFGVGFGRYQDTYDPVVEQGTTPTIRREARELPAHNQYLDKFATLGIPGGLAFIGMLAAPLVAGVRRARDPDVRAITVGYALVLFSLVLHPIEGAPLLMPLLAQLAVTSRPLPET